MSPRAAALMPRFMFVDQFCGGGGFSEALKLAMLELGLRPLDHDLSVLNHWGPALETHAANHPHAQHSKANVWRFDPRKAVPQGRVDLMTSSPTCTFFSTSRGGKPVSWDQRWGRMTPWQVYRWCKELDVRCLVVENVPEILQWGPVCNRSTVCQEHDWVCPPKSEWPLTKRGKRVKKVICGKRLKQYVKRQADGTLQGCHFRRWIARLRKLGYEVQFRILNAADYGDATTRKRFFMIARKDGLAIEWPTPSHSQYGNPDLFGGGTKRWRPASECIDWGLPGQSIFTREKPLTEKTLARILTGAEKCNWPQAFIVVLRNHMNGRPLTEGLPTITAGGTHLGLAQVVHRDPKPDNALVFQVNQGDERARNIRDANEQPLQTVVTGDSLGVASALVMRSDCTGGNGHYSRPADQPIYTPTTNGGIAVVEPVTNKPASSGSGPGKLSAPEARRAELALLLPQGSNSPARAASDAPVPTPVAIARTGLAAFVLNRHGDNGSARAHDVADPLPTPETSGGGYVVAPMIMANRNENVPRSSSAPMPPATTAPGGGIGVVEALVLGQHGGATARTVKEPAPTQAVRGAISLITPVTHADKSNRTRSVKEPLPSVTGANRGELAFVVPAFGERATQIPRMHSVKKPMPTVTAQGRFYLVQQQLRELGIDILFRMLEPKELAAAMGFPADYKWTGNKTQTTRMIGNAVAVNMAKALLLPILRSLLGARAKRRKVPA